MAERAVEKMPAKTDSKSPLLSLPLAGPKEAAAIFGWRTGSTWRRRFPEMKGIRTVTLLKGVFYVLEDVLRARYPEKSQQEIAVMIAEREAMKRANHTRRREWIGPWECARIAG